MKQTLFRMMPVVLAGLVTLGTVALASATAGPSAHRYAGLMQAGHAGHTGTASQGRPVSHIWHGAGADHLMRTSAPTAPSQRDVTPLIGNLGSHSHPITTSSEAAQRYFDEGLTLTFGFNHAEAVRSFQDAAELDPGCAMCHWGVALALGPNINAPMDAAAVPEAFAALQQAQTLASGASPAERAYIKALATRYVAEPIADRATLDLAYADAMRQLSRQYPDDLDAATLFAEALMDLTPWQFWTKDGQATDYTGEIVQTLESVLARNPEHPGANHYYIHAVEASRAPERALPSAERLERLAPGAGHLVHMPGHVYWRTGRYQDAVRVNEVAILADEVTIRRGLSGADQGSHSYYSLSYYPHNIHFLFAAAQIQGQSGLALTAARKLVASIPAEAYKAAPALEDFRPMVRFGRWDEILAEPQPPAELQYTTAIWYWARGLAYVRQGQPELATIELERLTAIAETDAMQELTLASFPKAATLLGIARGVLAGELAGVRGDTGQMIAQLEQAVEIQDSLAYIEPPAWFYPVRHNLGAALLQAGRAADAEATYREDLRQFPDNGWSQFGLAASLAAQGKTAEAAEAERRFAETWRQADVTLTGSRY
jgi:tetratricopeptide (TPR) repeat protein